MLDRGVFLHFSSLVFCLGILVPFALHLIFLYRIAFFQIQNKRGRDSLSLMADRIFILNYVIWFFYRDINSLSLVLESESNIYGILMRSKSHSLARMREIGVRSPVGTDPSR